MNGYDLFYSSGFEFEEDSSSWSVVFAADDDAVHKFYETVARFNYVSNDFLVAQKQSKVKRRENEKYRKGKKRKEKEENYSI